ncbi:MAG: polysulfide reductase NrfD [Syntrophorhabdaceae bacterium]|nr:polysulfide reductase NrfD [Syntrophorhabdaceae bacterium]
MMDKTQQEGRSLWVWLCLLLILILSGFSCYLIQLREGLSITGMGRDVSWGLYIANFTFLVGVAASAVMVVLPYYIHNYKAFGKITVLGEFLAVSAVLMAILFVFVDLGEPSRVLNIILHPSPRSLLFWDVFVLSGYLILNLLVAWQTLKAEEHSEPTPKWLKPFVLISIPWAVSIHTVTAFIYSGLGARPFWLTALLAPRFLASAFASGPAMLLLLCMIIKRTTGFDAGRQAIEKLVQIMTYALIINIFFFLVELFTVFYSAIPEHTEHFRIMLKEPPYAVYIWFSLILSWLSAFFLLYSGTRKNEWVFMGASIAIIISIWIEKGVGFVVTGFIPSPLNELPSYSPTIPEILISIGIYALGFLFLTIFYRFSIKIKIKKG